MYYILYTKYCTVLPWCHIVMEYLPRSWKQNNDVSQISYTKGHLAKMKRMVMFKIKIKHFLCDNYLSFSISIITNPTFCWKGQNWRTVYRHRGYPRIGKHAFSIQYVPAGVHYKYMVLCLGLGLKMEILNIYGECYELNNQ